MTTQAERAIENLLANARQNGRSQLSEPETKQILKLAGIPSAREIVVRSAAAAVDAARRFGFPVVMKIVSPDVPHKSDAGGVKLDLKSPAAVRNAYKEILANIRSNCKRARIDGVLVQETVQGLETIVGTTTNPQFGPVILFGLGGIFVEALNDVAFRMIPIGRDDARQILTEIRGAALLLGYRGLPKVNRENLAGTLMKLSHLAGRFQGSIREIDINPLVVVGGRNVAVDGLMTLHVGDRV